MSRRLGAQGRRQVHRRDPSKNPKACEPCGQPSHLTRNTVAALFSPAYTISGHREQLMRHHLSRSRRRALRLISAGVRPCDSSHRSKS